jgi:3-oxoacyl-[acyl-carrier-protein] synthase-3
MLYSAIAGTGSYIPTYRILTNQDLEKIVDTNDAWITSRTGIKTRHIAGPEETNATMGALALDAALKDASIKAEELELIICATNTNENNVPACAGEIQHRTGAKCGFFDVQAGCSAFSYALAMADSVIKSGLYKTIGVVGTDKLSAVTNYKDRETCVLFGDMASAMILRKSDKPGIVKHYLGGDGSQRDKIGQTFPDIERLIQRKEGKNPEVYTTGQGYLYMKGRDVFKFATTVMPEACLKVLEGTGYTINDVNWIVPHNANLRIIESAAERLAKQANIPQEEMNKRFYFNIDRYGNSSTASYPNSFHEARKKGLIKEGDLVILVGFGAGLTYGANLIKV